VAKQAEGLADTALNAAMDAVGLARREDPTIQFACEQPGFSEMRRHPRVVREWGEGILVQACAYGERQSGKTYRIWMNDESAKEFTVVDPTSPESQCRHCREGREHPQAYCPKKGQQKSRVRLEGYTTAAARNRVPPGLAEAVARAQQTARRKILERARG